VCPTTDVLPTLASCLTLTRDNATKLTLISDIPTPSNIALFSTGEICVICDFNYALEAVPLQAWNGPEGSRKLRFPDFVTTAQGGGKVVSLTHRPPLPPGNFADTHFC